MALTSTVKYETTIKDLKNISPESVLTILHNVRADIGRLDGSFTDVDLRKVLEIVEAGKYKVNGSSTLIDLSSAKVVIDAYRKYSEGGCQSCTSLGRETIDAQDATSGWYCQIFDPDYDAEVIGDRPGVRHSGFSPKVRRYYKTPCDDWNPRFHPKLEELIKQK